MGQAQITDRAQGRLTLNADRAKYAAPRTAAQPVTPPSISLPPPLSPVSLPALSPSALPMEDAAQSRKRSSLAVSGALAVLGPPWARKVHQGSARAGVGGAAG